MKLSPKISNLIDSLKALPGIGPKSAKRMALSLLSSEKESGLSLSKSIEDAFENIYEISWNDAKPIFSEYVSSAIEDLFNS